MPGYRKVFESMLDSSVWQEDSDTKVVWLTLILMADQNGFVEAAIPAIARRAVVELEACDQAMKKFSQPDEYSRSLAAEGRRIERVDGGWQIINFGKYREKLSIEDRREKERIRQQRHRAKSVVADDCHVTSRESRHTDTEAYTEIEAVKDSPPTPSYEPTLEDSDTLTEEICGAHPRYVSPVVTQQAIHAQVERIAPQRFDGDKRKALQFLLGRTVLYRRKTLNADKRFICGSDRWFREAKFDEDENLWETTSDTQQPDKPSRQRQGNIRTREAMRNVLRDLHGPAGADGRGAAGDAVAGDGRGPDQGDARAVATIIEGTALPKIPRGSDASGAEERVVSKAGSHP